MSLFCVKLHRQIPVVVSKCICLKPYLPIALKIVHLLIVRQVSDMLYEFGTQLLNTLVGNWPHLNQLLKNLFSLMTTNVVSH